MHPTLSFWLIRFLGIAGLMLNSTYAQVSYQPFAPLGATWYVNDVYGLPCDPPGLPVLRNFYTLKAEGDTSIAGKTYLKIVDESWGTYWLRQDHSKVFSYHLGRELLFFDFEVLPGDTVTFEFAIPNAQAVDTATFLIDSVATLALNNQNVITVSGHRINGLDSGAVYIYTEKIGVQRLDHDAFYSPFPLPNFISTIGFQIGPFLRCYEDGQLSYKSPTYLNYGDFICDYRDLTSRDGVLQTSPFRLWPIPAQDALHFTWETGLSAPVEIALHNIQGRKILQQRLNMVEGMLRLDTHGVTEGMYFLVVEVDNRRYAHQVWIAR